MDLALVVMTHNIERIDGKMYDYVDEVEVDPDKVVYPRATLKLKRTRKCYCYTGLYNEYPKKRALVCVIKASNGKAITAEDMVSFFESNVGKKFTSSCNHAYLEDLLPTGKADEYLARFGS